MQYQTITRRASTATFPAPAIVIITNNLSHLAAALPGTVPRYLDQQKQARWDRGDMMTIEDSASKTIGILGYGSIGRQTARLARALGMTVHAYTHRPRPTPESRRDRAWSAPGMGDPDGVLPSKWFSAETGTEFPGEEGKRHGDGQPKRGLHAFLASGLDLLVVATPLTAQTRGLLGRAEFDVLARAARGRRKAFVCNVARGEVVDTPALVAALEQGAVRGAAVDVTDPEPLPEHHPLWRAPNVIITPHVSGASTRYFERVLAILEENLRRLGEGAELVNRVDRERGY